MQGNSLWMFAVLGLSIPDLQEQTPKPPVPPPPVEQVQDDTATEIDPVQKWIDLLGDPRYRVREQAFEELRKLGAAAAPALKDAATSEDPEVRWRVERLQEALDQEPGEGPRLRRVEPERDEPRNDVPRSLEEWRDRRRGLPWGPQGSSLFSDEMKDMLRRIEELQANSMRELTRRPRGLLQPSLSPFEDFGSSLFEMGSLGPGATWTLQRNDNGAVRSLRIQVRPDGTVEAEEREGDAVETLEASSLDDLRAQRPEWFEGLGLTGRSSLLRPPGTRLRPGPGPAPAAPPQLGVAVEAVHPAVAEYLGLETGQGRMVREVVEGSLAHRLGVRANDLLLQVNGSVVRGADDIATALAGTAADGVAVVVLRRGQWTELREP